MFNRLLTRTVTISICILGGQIAAIAEKPYIESVQGKVELKRETASEAGFRVIKQGPIFLNRGDQLRLSNGAVARVICPGKSTPRDVRQAGERLGILKLCSKWKPTIHKGPPPLATIDGTDPQTPFLITPRRTLILSSTPTLRWNPVPETSEYTVKILNSQEVVWQTQVKEPQVTYPGSPILQPGIPYTVMIQTNTGKSSQTKVGSEFILLRDAEIRVVQAATNQITHSKFSLEIKALKLVEYYSTYEISHPSVYGLSEQAAKGYRLNAEAISVLETLLKQSQPRPLFYQTLGNLYSSSGIMLPAERAYLQAINRIQSSEDMEEWAIAAFGLGELYEAVQNPQQALLWYSQARIGFIFLDDKRAELLSRRINKLKNILNRNNL